MVTTATIDLISYTGSTDSKGSAKTSADDHAFNNVFENINKNYSKSQESSNNSVKDEKPNEVVDKSNKAPQSSDKDENTVKAEDANSHEVSSDAPSDAPSESSNETQASNEAPKTADDSQKAVSEKSQKADGSKNAQVAEDLAEQAVNALNDNSAKPVVVNAEANPPVEAQVAVLVSAEADVVKEVDVTDSEQSQAATATDSKSTEKDAVSLPEVNLSALMEGVFTSLTGVNNQNNQTSANAASSVQLQQPDTTLNDVSVDLTNLSKETIDNVVTNQVNNIKVQPQTQQAVFNLNVQAQENTQSSAPVVEVEVPVQAEIKSPVIAVATEALASDTNLNTNSVDTNLKNIKDILNKTALTQDVLDKTNAKIVSVETTSSSNSNSNNLLGGQNTGEQIIKLTMEGNSSKKSSNILPTADLATSQSMTFTKALDNVQAQAPKELNSSDVLSQINSKLDTLQDENTTKVTIVLKPEGLGKINLELINGKDGLVAKMTTDSAQVKQLLDKNLDSLRDTLGSQGVAVNTVSVKVDETQKQSNNMFSFDDGQARGDNQGSSNNSQSQNENKSAFSSEMEKFFGTKSADAESGEQNSDDSYVGQVNYKV